MLKNKKIIAIQGDDISTINVKTDTTLMLALEAQKRGYSIYWYKVSDLIFVNGNVFANTKIVKFNDNKKKFYKVIGSKYFCLSNAKYILMRQNPPFNMDYITGTFFLSCLNMKTKVINNPNAVRNVSEKFYSAQFHKFMPDTIFTKDIKIITEFLKKNKKIVLKPIHGYSGKNILFLQKMNLNKVVKFLRQHSHVMVQKFLPSIKKGDKRIFIINGKVKGCITRVSSKNSNLSNLSQGGTAIKCQLTIKEKKIASIIAKKLKKDKIFFAGIDFISGYLIGDINVTSPTGLPQLKDLTGNNLAKYFWDEARKLK